MRRQILFVFTAFLLFLSVSPRSSVIDAKAKPQDPKQRIDVSQFATLTASADKAEFDPREPIVVRVTLKNKSDAKPLFCEGGMFEYSIFEILATDGKGKDVPKTRFAQRNVGSPFARDMAVGPREECSFAINANLVRDLSASDRYTIRVRVNFTQSGPKGYGTVTSDPMEVKVRFDHEKK